jgi:hypothetical protein
VAAGTTCAWSAVYPAIVHSHAGAAEASNACERMVRRRAVPRGEPSASSDPAGRVVVVTPMSLPTIGSESGGWIVQEDPQANATPGEPEPFRPLHLALARRNRACRGGVEKAWIACVPLAWRSPMDIFEVGELLGYCAAFWGFLFLPAYRRERITTLRDAGAVRRGIMMLEGARAVFCGLLPLMFAWWAFAP